MHTKIKSLLKSLSILLFIISSSCAHITANNADFILTEVQRKLFEEDRFNLDEATGLQDEKVFKYLKALLNQLTSKANITELNLVISDTHIAQAMVSYNTRSVYISRGMLYAIRNESELATLLAHEVSHYKLKHGHQEPESSRASDIAEDIFERTSGHRIPEVIKEATKLNYYAQFMQQKEQEADEQGTLLTASLDYNPYTFADLLFRLDTLADKSISQKIKNIYGSHKTLGERAIHIRQFLENNNIQNKGFLNADNYLKHVRHLPPKPVPDLKESELNRTINQISSRTKIGKPLTVEEFLTLMEELRTHARNLGILNLISERHLRASTSSEDTDSEDDFMMEKAIVNRPWWQGDDPNIKKIKTALLVLSKMSLGFMPIVGDAVDLYEVITGKDFISGEDLNFGERAASAIGVIAGSGKAWRTAAKGIDGLLSRPVVSHINNPDEVSKAIKAAKEALEEAPILGKRVKTVEEIEKNYRKIKSPESHEALKKLANELDKKNIQVVDDWKIKITKNLKGKDQGIEFIYPGNQHTRVRVMPGNPNSEFPNSRKPHAHVQIRGRHIGIDGSTVGRHTESAHIPLELFDFEKYLKGKF